MTGDLLDEGLGSVMGIYPSRVWYNSQSHDTKISGITCFSFEI